MQFIYSMFDSINEVYMIIRFKNVWSDKAIKKIYSHHIND